MKFISLLIISLLYVCGCSSATYKIVDDKNNEIQSIQGDAPGGDTATIIVYYGPDAPPSIESNVDNEDFVRATAQIGRQALTSALNAVK